MAHYKVKPDKDGKVRSSPWKVHFAIKKGEKNVTIGYYPTEKDAQHADEITKNIVHDNPNESKEVITKRIRKLVQTSHVPKEIRTKNDRDIKNYMKEVDKNLRESIGDAKYFCTIGPQEWWCNICKAPFDASRRIEVKCCPAGCTDITERSNYKAKPGELIWL